ncbi:sensor histidine kinase [Niallia nealsonii]|uniref:histidine kinase n=1 Tax=Niallia nealsonii TaxID=115979 RepID=A0A2N0Z1S6_9BACI|nr:sensor histidine kinase [Niallia nealsonii]PKG23452.1 histidine kinase [Niallia nealsonii]
MIIKFLKEKRSWILFILFLQVLNLLIASMDKTISLQSMIYICFLAIIFFVIFLIIRYQKETAFYKSLADREDNLDMSNLPFPTSPFEEIMEKSIVQQTEQLKKEIQQHSTQLEQEKDELLSWIHEVKTPLTALHLIIERIEDQKLKTALTYEWLRIHLLLDQQLHQKRIPFMQNDLYIETIDLETVIFDEIRTLQSWCMQKGIGFEVDLTVSAVLTDSKWLAFIFRQIFTNGVKYSENADIIIQSTIKNEQVIVEIQDFGRGIEAHDLPRIFDKGFTSTANHHNQQSTGMGLYLVKKVAEALLIHIDVKSVVHQGTTFTLTFPKKNDLVQITGM